MHNINVCIYKKGLNNVRIRSNLAVIVQALLSFKIDDVLCHMSEIFIYYIIKTTTERWVSI